MSVADWFVEQVTSGTMLLAVPVAAAAGLVSFFSPCVVPLLPGYVSYATGLSGSDLETGRRGRLLAGSALFVLGFSVWFVLVGTATGALGDWLVRYRQEISTVLGAVTIVVGLVFMGVLPWLQRDVRVHRVPAVGLAAAPLLGLLFAIGWTPCLGPTLTAVNALAWSEGTAGRGAALMLAYSLGLGIPFLVLGLAYRRMLGTVAFVRRHQLWVTRAGGLMLVVVGLLLVTGLWDLWIAELRGWVAGSDVPV